MSAPTSGSTVAPTQSWHAALPDGWQTKRLGHLTTKIGSGKTPSGGADAYVDDGVMFLRSQNVHDDGLRLDDVVSIPHAVDESMRETRVQHGDILLNITGASLGRTCIVPSDAPPANVNQHVAIVRVRDASLRPFLSWALKSHGVQVQIEATQNGAAREGLNFVQIARLTVPIPAEGESKAIAAFLERETAKIDALVAEQERLMALLREKRLAVISHAVTKGLNPDVPMMASGMEWLGEAPAHWSNTRLRFVVAEAGIQMGPFGGMLLNLESSDTGFKVFGQENTMAGDLTRGSRWIDEGRYHELSAYHVAAGDLLLTRKGSLGNAFLVRELTVTGIIDSDTIRVRIDNRIAHREFVALLLHEAHYISEQIAVSKRGAILSGLNSTTIANLAIVLPPLDEQTAILDAVEKDCGKIDRAINDAKEVVSLLTERRAALISAAVTGQIDVRHLAAANAA